METIKDYKGYKIKRLKNKMYVIFKGSKSQSIYNYKRIKTAEETINEILWQQKKKY